MSEINKTFLTLIPKVEQVTSIKHFRSTGHCNVSYKTITKLVVVRIRPHLDKLIGPAQCAFVPKMQGQDNIIVAQKILHSMRFKKGSNGWMAIKVDLEKAYDRLGWSFIKDTLQDIWLPENIISLIWFCISTPTMKLLWNGEALEEFSPL